MGHKYSFNQDTNHIHMSMLAGIPGTDPLFQNHFKCNLNVSLFHAFSEFDVMLQSVVFLFKFTILICNAILSQL